jgi:transposase-like protein
MEQEPKTLQQAILYFANPVNCREYLVARRWPDGVSCPRCGSKAVSFLAKYNRWQCSVHHDQRQFTLKTGTIMEDSPIGLDKWLMAMWMLGNCKNGISSYEVHRAIKVTQKSAWFMLQRIRKAMQDDLTGGNLQGEIKIDETFIGGKSRNMHRSRRNRIKKALNTGLSGGAGKSIVVGMLELGKRVRATVVADRSADSMQESVLGNVERGSTIYSDEFAGTWKMEDQYDHQVVNHLEEYVDGQVHTNGMENFWSLLKRGIGGTYISVEPFHLFRYVDEQAFRYNNRKDAFGKPLTDSDRFSTLVTQIVGKRLTFAEVTGKAGPSSVN